MKFDFKNLKSHNAFNYFLAAVATVVFYFIVVNLTTIFSWIGAIFKILSPLVFAFVLAYILNSPMRFFDEKVFKFVDKKKPHRRLRRILAITAALLCTVIVLGALMAVIIPQLYQSVVTLVGNAKSYIQNAEMFLINAAEWLNLPDSVMNAAVNWVEDYAIDFVTQLKDLLPTLLTKAFDYSKTMVSGIADVIIGVILCVYLLYNKEFYFARTKKLQYALFPKKFVDSTINVAHESHSIFTNFIIGKLLDSLMVCILCMVGCLILRIPYAGLFSAIISVFNIIPVFGPVVGTCISTFILLVIDPLKALWFLIFVVVLLQIDGNIIEPKILGDITGLSAFWVMIAILVGGGCFGFIGMFLGVPTFAVLYSLVGKLINKLLKKKDMPLELEAYASEEHKII